MSPARDAALAPGAPAAPGGALWRLLFSELSPNARRLRVSIRTALITALGAGLIASLHIDNGFGAMSLFRILAQHGTGFTVGVTGLLMVLAGVFEASSLVLSGILVQSPVIELTFFGLFTTASSYVLMVLALGSAYLVLQIGFLSGFVTMNLNPETAGWTTGYMFAGLIVAYALVFLFEAFLWPDPSEAALLESLTDRLERKRRRMRLAAARFLSDSDAQDLAVVPTYTMLATHLELMKRVNKEQPDERRRAELLAAITQGEQIHHGVEMLAAVSPPGRLAASTVRDLRQALEAVDALMDLDARLLAAGLPATVEPERVSAVAALEAALEALDRDVAAETGLAVRGRDAEALSAFVAAMHALAATIERTPIQMMPPPAPTATRKIRSTRLAAALGLREDPALLFHSLKIGIATTAALVVGLAAQHPELEALIWTVLTVGPPTYGATVHKMTLRVVGGTLGGVLAIPTILILAPNFTSVGSYVIALFCVLVVLAYIGNSTSRISYAGMQAGVSFMIAIVNPGPSVDVTAPLWRIWSIVIGLVITAIVFLVIWPDYAGDALAPRLVKFLRAVLEVIPPADTPIPAPERIRTVQMFISQLQLEILGVADDARLEGARAGVDHEAIIDASGALMRIGYRMSGVMAARVSETDGLPDSVRAARDAFETALRDRLRYLLDRLEGRESAAPPSDLDQRLAQLVAADVAAPSWPRAETRVRFLADLEAYRRIVRLVPALDRLRSPGGPPL